MGQKVNPISMRLGINRTWDSRWYAGKNEYSKLIQEDIHMREMIFKDLKNAAIANVVIERPHKNQSVPMFLDSAQKFEKNGVSDVIIIDGGSNR